jgi:hypothetical protein
VGAIASVDGSRLGVTPVVWGGDGGIAHEFTFVMAGHALARYRFVPVTNGIVHGTLARIPDDAVVPALAPSGGTVNGPPRSLPPPPPPIDAAPPPPPIDAGELVDAALVPTGPLP